MFHNSHKILIKFIIFKLEYRFRLFKFKLNMRSYYIKKRISYLFKTLNVLKIMLMYY